MNSPSFIPAENLTFTTVESERQQLLEYCRSSQNQLLIVDLTSVSQCDSAGLALLIEFKRLAKLYNKQSRIEGITKSILSLAEFCGVNQLLVEDEVSSIEMTTARA